MPVYIPTAHSKIRYCERVDKNYNHRDEDVRLAIKYGLKIDDVPKKYKKERSFLGRKKIFYNDNIYVFANSEHYKLITVYGNNYPVLKKLFEKKERLRKEAKKKKYEDKFETIIIRIKEKYTFKLTLKNDKIIRLKQIEYKENMKIKVHTVTDIISKILKGNFISSEILLDMNSCSQIDKMIYCEVLRIPFGKATTYKKLAQRFNNKISIQTIASSLKRCPFLFLIPSHRVIRTDGKIGSYCIDSKYKKRLLKREKIKFKN